MGFLFWGELNKPLKKRKINMNYGDPVKFEMRFATDTNISPYKENRILLPSFRKTSVFKFSGNWSLFDMINMHKIVEDSKTIGKVLKFEFPVKFLTKLILKVKPI